jgi:hypothetical protein
MKILQKLNKIKQRNEMKNVEQKQKKILNKANHVDKLVAHQNLQNGQFPNSELLARKIKAEMVRKAQEEFALVMKQLVDSDPSDDKSDIDVQNCELTDDAIEFSHG